MKKFNWGLFFCNVVFAMLVLLIVGMIGLVFIEEVGVEVESYTIEAEITHLDYSSDYVKNNGKVENFTVSVCDGDFATVFDTNEKFYASHKVGDLVTVKVTEKENILYNYFDYELLDG